ncbi:hypothetical protein C8Q80DRAFT_1178930 [Daedaleopsis nitida]|nr:hypothetical protein C8Q80DRAFT_1178930 [Daedaleopsis nitida]
MAPKGKSSASSATRKKHARKAAGAQGIAEEPQMPKEKKPKGKDKKSKKEPRKKVYIPPAKPAPVQPDPLDTLGLAQRLPPELLVILRLLSKKDSTTKRRALEDFQTAWIGRAQRGEDSEYVVHTLQETIPVWLHHIPSLFLHPSRRIRLIAIGLHTSILQISSLRTQLFFQLREVVSSDQAETILGSWCLAVHDADRQVSAYAKEAWSRYVSLKEASNDKLLLDAALLPRLWDFLQRTLLDPAGVYLYINPPQPAFISSTHGKKGSGRGTPIRKDEEANSRARSEDDEEKEQDRKARLRVGAFGATEWVLNAKYAAPGKGKEKASDVEQGERSDNVDDLLSTLANPALWSSLYHGRSPPFVDAESFGFEQPVVRRSAWSLLQTLLQTCQGHLGPLLPVLSGAVLRSAWVEPDTLVRAAMWQPLLIYLNAYPNAWTLEMESQKEDNDDDDDDEDSDHEDDEGPNPPPSKPSADSLASPSHAYIEFLQFLVTGCSGSPVQGYPTVLLILSTIPSSVISSSSEKPLEELFISFWAAVDARVLNSLDRVAASTAFLSSLLECLTFVVRRTISSSHEEAVSLLQGRAQTTVDIDAAVKGLLCEQTRRTWDELSSGRLKVPGKDAGALLAKTFVLLYRLRVDLFDAAWSVLAEDVQKAVAPAGKDVIPDLVPELLKQLSSSMEKGTAPGDAGGALVLEVVKAALDQCSALLEADETEGRHVVSFVNILDTFGELVFADAQIGKNVDILVQSHTLRLLTTLPSLLMLYFKYRDDQEACLAVWHKVLEAVARNTHEIDRLLLPLLNAADEGALPTYLRPQGEELHEAAGSLLTEALSGPVNAKQVSAISRLLTSYEPFVDRSCRENMIRGLVDAFVLHFDTVLHDENASVDAFSTPLHLLHSLVENDKAGILIDTFAASFFPYIFLFAFLLPHVQQVAPEQQTIARGLWDAWLASASADATKSTSAVINHLLRELLLDCLAKTTPEQILRAASAIPFTAGMDVLSDVFPSRADLDVILDALPSTPLDASLAVLDPTYDSRGLSKYARIVYALLLHVADDRQSAKENVWVLHHCLAFAIYAEEFRHLPAAGSPVFSAAVSLTTLQSVTDRVQQLSAYLLSSTAEEHWHVGVTNALIGQGAPDGLDGVAQLIVELVGRARRSDSVRESRVLHAILRHAMSTATKADAEQWMLVARKLEKQAPHTVFAIVLSLARYAPETARLERYRNELAAGMLGIPASKANTEGLWFLRNLAASAPDPESDVVFLQQLRAVNLVKACQQWITSDEDLEEDVQSEMTLVFASLVPILSNVPGAHWDLMFDVVENNLENASLDDPSTYVTLSRTLQLFLVVEEYASTNKTLKAAWEERKSANLLLIRDIVSLKLEDEKPSTPLSTCRELALQIVQDLPSTLLTRETLPKMCHLVTDNSVTVQRMAYQLLHEAAKKYTEELVIEAAVDTEGIMKAELPTELLDILQRSLNHEAAEEYGESWFGYLLAWMITLDLFLDASLKVKSGYIDQLRDLDLVGSRLLPAIFGILDLYGGMAKAFKLEVWDVDECYLELYAPDTPLSLRLLTAHLYYRALLLVPSLIRNWLVECRDRQLSTAVASYTSRHFSPAIIRTELARVKDPSVAEELSGENVTVKVASAINEVTASYAVDEQNLELTIKLPADWPLHTIEIRDSKLVGVTEDRWRAWVLGVQQILTFRSGSIVDGLSFFLKNVMSHFEGIAECPICYSVVNATDGSLPKKPCKTCKNRFHAACLYKWFNTSHSSSCPLCRSEIMTGK